jgi:5-methylcytosine-specific restriction enzyme subunit McrC
VLFLLSYALDRKAWPTTRSALASAESLFEAVIPVFVALVQRAFKRGILQGYRTREDALNTVRGRIRFDDQIRKRHGIFPPIEVRYDEFTTDTEMNRLIKAAAARLGKLRIRSSNSRSALRAVTGRLAPVKLVDYVPRALPEIEYNRLNEHYRPAVELAKLILQSSSFELLHGTTRAKSFLLNMNSVFEDFVVIGLREALGLSERAFPQNNRGRRTTLDAVGAVRLKPDISWWEGKRCLFVGDVKYKKLEPAGFKHGDLYQLLAYAVATDLPGGILIYAKGESEPVVHEIVHAGKQIEVATLDLEGSPADILAQLRAIARRINTYRSIQSRDRVA